MKNCALHNKTNLSDLSHCEHCFHREENMICGAAPDLWQLLDAVKIKSHYKPNQTVFYQGSEPLGLYTVSQGLIKLESVSEAGQSHTVRYVGAGGAIGYQALFANEKHHVSAITLEPTTVCFIPKSTILDIFKQHPEASLRVMQALSKDLHQAENKWIDQMDKDVPCRIAEALIFLQDNFTHQNWTRKEISEWAGTTPESVIRTLAQFEKAGLIDQSEGRSIKILQKDDLIERTCC